jgi:hypothetical protein
LPEWRNLVCGAMIVILPTSFMAQDSTRGMLHSDGGTWLNGNPAPASAAVFPDSLVQTQAGHSSRIDVAGSNVLVLPETEVQFLGSLLVLTHGSLQLVTTSKMEVLVGCIRITPTTSDRTEYEVTDVDGRVRIAASKSNVKVHAHGSGVLRSKQGESSDAIVHEGEQSTRDERCGAPPSPTQTVTATGPFLDSWWAKGVGIGVVATLTCLGLCHEDDPISPSKP